MTLEGALLTYHEFPFNKYQPMRGNNTPIHIPRCPWTTGGLNDRYVDKIPYILFFSYILFLQFSVLNSELEWYMLGCSVCIFSSNLTYLMMKNNMSGRGWSKVEKSHAISKYSTSAPIFVYLFWIWLCWAGLKFLNCKNIKYILV